MNHQEDDHFSTAEKDESFEACNRRLSKQLTEYEQTCIDTQGRANQLRKERDAERTQNDKLRKELDKLNNQLLRERTRVAFLEKEVNNLQDKLEPEEETREDGECASTNLQSHPQSTTTTVQPLGKDDQDLLTAKLHELQNAIQINMDRNANNKQSEEQYIALSILIESLQNYMHVELENKMQDLHETKKSTDDADSMLCENNNYSLAADEAGGAKKDPISNWVKFIVYLGPVFLSLLCYAVFISKK